MRLTTGLVLAVVSVVVSVAAGAGLVAAEPTTGAPEGDGATSAIVAARSRSGAADDYWTEERMLAAIPTDIEVPDEGLAPRNLSSEMGVVTESGPAGDASDPVYPVPEDARSRAVPVPATTGKLFYTWAGGNYVCSASVINSAKKNVIMTAGHCVYEAKKGWHDNLVFVPAYYNGSAPYGKWSWSTARTFTAWQNDSAWSHDQAFLTLAPLGGRNIVDVVGGNGLSWGYGTGMAGVRIWGYPAEGKYNGQLPYYCDGTTTDRSAFDDDAQLVCDMNGGASGGAWLRARIGDNLGYVYAVTSRRTLSGTPALISTPNPERVKTMFDLM
ncbi:hypothetical protein DOE76_02100 [Leifsonia sp. ku-ls]|nr:hypothetical protein DOE76_02100 [Leifsonia sp. ku-ls]